MGISKKEVEHIAKLARLEFTGDEFEHLTGQLSAILNYVSKLNELNTEDVEPKKTWSKNLSRERPL